MTKRIIGMIMAAALAVSLLPGAAVSAAAQDHKAAAPAENGQQETTPEQEAAAASAQSLPDLTGGSAVITLMWRTDAEDPETQDPVWQWAQGAFDTWEEKENKELKLVPVKESEQEWRAALPERLGEGGECPDLILGSTSHLPADAEAGLLTDLSAQAASYSAWDWFYDPLKDLSSAGNGVYGVPCGALAAGLWYDADRLAEAGVTDYDEDSEEQEDWTPSSVGDLREACRLLQRQDRDLRYLDASGTLFYELLLLSCGGRPVTAQGTWITESEPSAEAIAALRDLYAEGYAFGPAGAQEEDAPSAAIIPCFVVPAQMADGETGFAAMPALSEAGAPVTVAEGTVLEIPECAPDKEAAWAFLCRMMEPECYLPYAVKTAAYGGLCVRTDLAQSEAFDGIPFYAARQALLSGAFVRPRTPLYTQISHCVLEMMEALEEDPSEDAAEAAAQALRAGIEEAAGAENCWPKADPEEDAAEEESAEEE